jgi:hypothetical protein
MPGRSHMAAMIRLLLVCVVCVVCVGVPGAAGAAADVTLFRVFLVDGTSVVSYGELAKVDDRVIFSMPVGGGPDEPRLQAVSLPAAVVDWRQTDRYAASARYQWYAATRGEQDYQRLNDDVAAALNEIAVSTDRVRAVALAEQARQTLADWPRTHHGYRQHDVRDIVGLLDGAISALRGTARPSSFELSLVAMADPIELEPVVGMPSPREQVDQIVRVLDFTSSATDRVSLLHSAVALLNDSRNGLDATVARPLRRTLEEQLRQEIATDARYTRLSQRLAASAARAASGARISDVERVLTTIPKEDAKLGGRRPEIVQALLGWVQTQLEAARRLRLLQDQWTARRPLDRDYQRAVASHVGQLMKAQPLLEAIRRFEGPAPERLTSLRTRLSGGAVQLQRLRTPDHLRSAHELLVSAWRFAENAANARAEAVASGNIATASQASSAAAGALLMLDRAQQEMRVLLEPPRLQ